MQSPDDLSDEPQEEEEPKPKKRQIAPPKLPALPTGLELPALAVGVRLRQVSLGKPVANVSATLTFDLDIPGDEISELMGEHAYTAGFLGGFLGEGVLIKEAPLSVDEENNVHQKLKVRIPRYLNEATDQIIACVAPLIGGAKVVDALFKSDWPWRLNVTVDIPGELALYSMQQSMDLTTRAE